MRDAMDAIGDVVAGKPWLALGAALVCLLVISAGIAMAERCIVRKLARDTKQRKEEDLRSRDS